MSDVVVHELNKGPTKITQVSNDNLDNNKMYSIYVYDTNLRYGISHGYYSYRAPILFDVLKRKEFDRAQ